MAFWDEQRGSPVFQVYHSMLFGLPNAVTSFNRWSKLAEALVRRLLFCLFSMYFDEVHSRTGGRLDPRARAKLASS